MRFYVCCGKFDHSLPVEKFVCWSSLLCIGMIGEYSRVYDRA